MAKVSKVVRALSRNRAVLAKSKWGGLYVLQPTGKAEYLGGGSDGVWHKSVNAAYSKAGLLKNIEGDGYRFISSWRP